MQIYLPIAEIPVQLELIIFLGGAVGFVSGMFGVGGGFLLTPLLFFMGVPPAVAVATGVNQVVGSSFSGFLTQLRRNAVDLKMGAVLLVGGVIGSSTGVWAFNQLREMGQFDLIVSITYVILLGIVGGLMMYEGILSLRARPPEPAELSLSLESQDSALQSNEASKPKKKRPLTQRLPFRMVFPRSRLHISIIPPLIISAFVGFLGSLLGVGGGFILIPAMIYILGMPTNVVIGTSLFQVLIVSGLATMMHAISSQTVDVILALCLLLGGVFGAQIGAKVGAKLQGEQLRVLLAAIVLAVAIKLLFDLVTPPTELFILETLE